MKLYRFFLLVIWVAGMYGLNPKEATGAVKQPVRQTALKAALGDHGQDRFKHLPEYVEAFPPKLDLTTAWLKEHKGLRLPTSLKGQTIAILGFFDGKTLVADEKHGVYEIHSVVTGEYSAYGKKYLEENNVQLDKVFLPDPLPAGIPSYGALQLPMFKPYSGSIFTDWYSGDGSMGGTIHYRGERHLMVSVSFKWTKQAIINDSSGQAMAEFVIPVGIQNETASAIRNLSFHFYLQGADGKKYYAAEKTSIAELPPIPANVEGRVPVTLKIRAPADDFSLNLFVDGQGQAVYGFTPSENTALENDFDDFNLKDINQAMVKYLGYASTKEGYNRILARIAFLRIRMGNFPEALAIANKLLEEPLEQSVKNLVQRERIVALIHLGMFKSALIQAALTEADSLPDYYCEYLIQNLLHQIEREFVLESALALPANRAFTDQLNSLKKRSLEHFLSYTLVTPLPSDDLKQKFQVPGIAKDRFDLAVKFFKNKNYRRAKYLLVGIVKQNPKAWYESPEHKKSRIAPGALALLSRIYWEVERNIPAALECAQGMIDDYFQERGISENEWLSSNYSDGAPAGAEGLLLQMEILSDRSYAFDGLRNLNPAPNHAQCIQLAHRLLQQFDGIVKPCYEDCSNYEYLAAWYLKGGLQDKNAELKEWKKEIRVAIKETRNQALRADLLLTLGGKCASFNDATGAVAAYNEVIETYSEAYTVNVFSCENSRFYAIEAYEALLGLDLNPEQRESVQRDLKNHCRKMRAVLVEKQEWQDACFDENYQKYL